MAPSSRAETLRTIIEAERAGAPFLIVEPAEGQTIVHRLRAETVLIGRASRCDVVVADGRVSRGHLRIQPRPGGWVVDDDGLARNGTWVNGHRLIGPRRLTDKDVVTLGASTLTFRAPRPETLVDSTIVDAGLLSSIRMTPAQRRVLVALSRPCIGDGFAAPATNHVIAEELFLSIDTVKAHLRALFEQFAIGDLPNNAKRARLVETALNLGVLNESDY
jgi:pSer/pThr/pTyr-binding forkhead associated (FHA) protein